MCEFERFLSRKERFLIVLNYFLEKEITFAGREAHGRHIK